MIDWFVLLTPLLLLPVVMLFVFVGCAQVKPVALFFPFGRPGDIPVPGDYFAEGVTRAAFFRPSDATWHIFKGDLLALQANPTSIPDPASLVVSFTYGLPGDIPVPGDYFEDGFPRPAFFRSGGLSDQVPGEWHIGERVPPGQNVTVQDAIPPIQFPQKSNILDIPLPPGKYLTSIGENSVCLAVYRAFGIGTAPPGPGEWNFRPVAKDTPHVITPQISPPPAQSDTPIPGDYEGRGDGSVQAAIFRNLTNEWIVFDPGDGRIIRQFPVDPRLLRIDPPPGSGGISSFGAITAVSQPNSNVTTNTLDSFIGVILLPPGAYFGASSSPNIMVAVCNIENATWFLLDRNGTVLVTLLSPDLHGSVFIAPGDYHQDGSIKEVLFQVPTGFWSEATVPHRGLAL